MTLVILVALATAAARDGLVGSDSTSTGDPSASTRAAIERVVDGDTLVVRVAGRRDRVRLLGIDTPETVKPGAAVERCGPEASARAAAWARRHPSVRLVGDAAAPDADRYGRLLRYVEPTDDSRDLSTVQAAAGLARVASYGQDLGALPELRRAQARAKQTRRGLWGGACGG